MDSKLAIRQLMQIKKLTKGKEMRLAAEWDESWKVLIATILSAVTKDETTIEVCERLFKKYDSPKKIGETDISTIELIIKRVNFYKTKARNIKETSKIIDKVGIPKTIDKLIELPGVGRKVANVYLAEAHGADAIGVDTHVFRLARKLKWSKSNNPERVEKDLEELFPKRYWRSINHILVVFGKSIGRSRRQEDEVLAKLIKRY